MRRHIIASIWTSSDWCAACFLLQQLSFALLSVAEVDIPPVASMDHPSTKALVIDEAMYRFLDGIKGDNTKTGTEAWY